MLPTMLASHIRGPVLVPAALFLGHLPADAPAKAAYNKTSAWARALMSGTWMELRAPTLGRAQPWLLWMFGEQTLVRKFLSFFPSNKANL